MRTVPMPAIWRHACEPPSSSSGSAPLNAPRGYHLRMGMPRDLILQDAGGPDRSDRARH